MDHDIIYPYGLCSTCGADQPLGSAEAIELFERLHELNCGPRSSWVHFSERRWRNTGHHWDLENFDMGAFSRVYSLEME